MTEKTKRTIWTVVRLVGEVGMVTGAAVLGGSIFADKACGEIIEEIRNIKEEA